MLASGLPQHHKYLVHSSILAFEPLAATPPLSNPRDLPTHTPSIALLGLPLAILSLSAHSCSLTVPHSLALVIFLSPLLSPTAYVQMPLNIFSLLVTVKICPLKMEWSCQQFLYRSLSHTLYPVLKPSQGLSSPVAFAVKAWAHPWVCPITDLT